MFRAYTASQVTFSDLHGGIYFSPDFLDSIFPKSRLEVGTLANIFLTQYCVIVLVCEEVVVGAALLLSVSQFGSGEKRE